MRAPPESQRTDYRGAPTFIAIFMTLVIFFCVGQGEGPAKSRKILSKYKSLSTVYTAVTGDDAVAQNLVVGHAKIGASVNLEAIHLYECFFIQEQVNSFPSRQFAGFMLFFQSVWDRPPVMPDHFFGLAFPTTLCCPSILLSGQFNV